MAGVSPRSGVGPASKVGVELGCRNVPDIPFIRGGLALPTAARAFVAVIPEDGEDWGLAAARSKHCRLAETNHEIWPKRVPLFLFAGTPNTHPNPLQPLMAVRVVGNCRGGGELREQSETPDNGGRDG